MPEVYLDRKSITIFKIDKMSDSLYKEIIDDLNYQTYEHNIECYDIDIENSYITVFGTRKELYKYLHNLSTITEFIINAI